MAAGKRPLVEILDTKAESKKQADSAVKERLDFHQNLIYAVLIVTGVGLIAIVIATFDIFIQYKRFDADKYNEYTKTLNLQNNLITANQNKDFQDQINQIKTDIDNLWKNKYPIRR